MTKATVMTSVAEHLRPVQTAPGKVDLAAHVARCTVSHTSAAAHDLAPPDLLQAPQEAAQELL